LAVPLRRFTADEYERMCRLGIVEESSVDRQDGRPLRFSVDAYHRLIETGILREGEPVELLEGWIVTKMGRNPPHDLAVSLAEYEIDRRLPAAWFRRVQSAVTTAGSEPEPDIAVVRGPRRRYAKQHPTPQDTALGVEVADTSLAHDRGFKASVYAKASIPVYWIINIPESHVEVYTDPTGPGPSPCYRQRQDFRLGTDIPLVLDGQEVGRIPVQDLLP